MSEKSSGILALLEIYGSWLLLAVLGVLTAFQWRATLVYAGLRAVENPAVNRLGWNTATINGLNRFLVLVLGIIWLGVVTFLERYLREAHRQQQLRKQVLRILLFTGILYGLSYLLLLLL
jgi:hypothetical protein